MNVRSCIMLLAAWLCVAGAGPAAAQWGEDPRLDQALLRAVKVEAAGLQGTPVEELLPEAEAVFGILRTFGARGQDDAVAVGYYLVKGYLAQARFAEAERLARWRLQEIPAMRARLKTSSRSWESVGILEAHASLWGANLDLARALAEREQWEAALPYQRAALEWYLDGEGRPAPAENEAGAIKLRSLLASALGNSENPARLAEAAHQYMRVVELLVSAGQGCSAKVWEAITRLSQLPPEPLTRGARGAMVRERMGACSNFPM